MIISNEYEYRYILKILDEELELIKELRCDHLSKIAKEIPEVCNVAVYNRVEKLRNRVIIGFKKSCGRYPFSVE